MEKKLKKNIYVCVYIHKKVNHSAVHLKVKKLCKSAILELQKNPKS